MDSFMEWADYSSVIKSNYFIITYNLFNIEHTIHAVTGKTIQSFSSSPSMYESRRFEYPWVFWHLPKIKKDMKILDAGGGETSFQYLLSHYYDTVYNVDAAKSYLDRVNMIQEKMNDFKNIHTVEGNISSLLFSDDFFDACVCISVLEHSEKPLDVFHELIRVTKGPVLITMDVAVDDNSSSHVSLSDLIEFSNVFNFVVPEQKTTSIRFRLKDGDMFDVACLYLSND